jgi:hypothetical protein
LRSFFEYTLLSSETDNEEQLLAKLEQAVAGLLYMSEDDYPFQIVCWKNLPEVTPQFLRHIAKQSADAFVETETLERFMGFAATEQEWHTPTDRATAQKYQRLLKLLKENLEGLQVYRIGERNIAVYLVGRAAQGNWIGLSTRVLET